MFRTRASRAALASGLALLLGTSALVAPGVAAAQQTQGGVVQRILVHSSLYDDFKARFVAATQAVLHLERGADREMLQVGADAAVEIGDLPAAAKVGDPVAAALGVTDAVPETIEASLQLSEAALVGLGVPTGLVIASIHERRDVFRSELQGAAKAAGRETRAFPRRGQGQRQ